MATFRHRSFSPLSRFWGGGLLIAAVVTTGSGATRAAVSTSPLVINDPNANVTIDATGTRTVSGTTVTTNGISTYDVPGIDNFSNPAVTATRYQSLTVGTGGTVRQSLTSTQVGDALILSAPGTTTIAGGTVELDGGDGPSGTVVTDFFGSTIDLRSGEINDNVSGGTTTGQVVNLGGSSASLVMTGGSINDTVGLDHLVALTAARPSPTPAGRYRGRPPSATAGSSPSATPAPSTCSAAAS